jgi:hypothetical protein
MRPMRTLGVMIGVAMLALSSCGATLRINGTAPTQLNDGTCAARILSAASSLQMIHARVVTRSLEDSLAVMPGATWAFQWQTPAGSYPIMVWASLAAKPQEVSCDTTVTRDAPAKPDVPRVN